MITNIQNIKKIGCFDDFESKDIKPFNRVNIFYGTNGCGKTILSNIIYLLSRHCKDRQEMFKELIDNDSELKITTDNDVITQENIIEKDLDLYVFNSKFVSDSVYNGTSANVDLFSDEIKLTNKEIDKIEGKLKTLTSKQKKLTDWNKEINETLEKKWKTYNKEFQDKISDARLTGFKPPLNYKATGDLNTLKNELAKLYWRYDNVSKQSVTIARLETFKAKLDSIKNIDIDLEKIQIELATPVSTIAKGKIGERIKLIQQLIEDKDIESTIGDLNEWYRIGSHLLELSKESDSHCPLCDTDLSNNINVIISDYSNYFSNAILNLFNYLDDIINSLENFLKSNFLDTNSLVSHELIENCRLYDIELDDFKIESFELIYLSIQKLNTELKRKKQTPDEKIIIDKEILTSLGKLKNSINIFKETSSKSIEKEITELKKKNPDLIIKSIKEKIKIIVSVELNNPENNIFPSNRRTNSEISQQIDFILNTVNPLIDKLQIQRSEEVAKLNAESKYTNLYLKNFGINHFSIERIKDKAKDNIIITFLKTGKTKNKFSLSLSEGEKTALAFSYFISKLRVEKIEGNNTEFENCIIVIDDPISSLDDNRLFQTANLIDSFLFYNKINKAFQPKQLFIFSHNLVFIKYLYNALKTNPELEDQINEYYIPINPPNIRNLPSGLKNFTNTYITKLKEIIDYKERRLGYETVKNYLPNYIRIVLETFLSFKLAKVNADGNMPGLSHLIKAMVKEFESVEDFEIDGLNKDRVIERLNHLKKIADYESHGNIHKAEEYQFISESELTQFANHTIQIIGYIDDIHFKRVMAHTS